MARASDKLANPEPGSHCGVRTYTLSWIVCTSWGPNSTKLKASGPYHLAGPAYGRRARLAISFERFQHQEISLYLARTYLSKGGAFEELLYNAPLHWRMYGMIQRQIALACVRHIRINSSGFSSQHRLYQN